jgi:hypothetical protein
MLLFCFSVAFCFSHIKQINIHLASPMVALVKPKNAILTTSLRLAEINQRLRVFQCFLIRHSLTSSFWGVRVFQMSTASPFNLNTV